jgi:GNAT superfamily N-acetyltransferase
MALFRAIWGDIEPAQPAYHHWQYAHSPAGPAAATIARDAATEQVVGHEATIPINMSIAGKECLASLALNSSTLSEWRGQGVFSGLIRAACEVTRERGIAFIYGFPNEQAYGPRVKHCGYKDVGSVPLLVRPLNPRTGTATGNRFLSWLASPAGLVFREPAGKAS